MIIERAPHKIAFNITRTGEAFQPQSALPLSAPIRATIEHINDTDNAAIERIVAEESATGWKIAA